MASRVTMGPSPTVGVLSRGCTRPAARAIKAVGHISLPPGCFVVLLVIQSCSKMLYDPRKPSVSRNTGCVTGMQAA